MDINPHKTGLFCHVSQFDHWQFSWMTTHRPLWGKQANVMTQHAISSGHLTYPLPGAHPLWPLSDPWFSLDATSTTVAQGGYKWCQRLQKCTIKKVRHKKLNTHHFKEQLNNFFLLNTSRCAKSFITKMRSCPASNLPREPPQQYTAKFHIQTSESNSTDKTFTNTKINKQQWNRPRPINNESTQKVSRNDKRYRSRFPNWFYTKNTTPQLQ
jgi:hypothetical protein